MPGLPDVQRVKRGWRCICAANILVLWLPLFGRMQLATLYFYLMQRVACYGYGKYKLETKLWKGDCSGEIIREGFGGGSRILKGEYA